MSDESHGTTNHEESLNTQPQSDLEKLMQECQEYKSGWQRAVADYHNLKKETEARKVELFQWSEEQIVNEFIPVYDNFKKAFEHHPELDISDEFHKKVKGWVDGIGFIKKQFEDVLKNHGVEEIKTDGVFDTQYHEVVAEEEHESESGSIIRVVDSGYLMRGKVIKVAKVVVSKGKSSNEKV